MGLVGLQNGLQHSQKAIMIHFLIEQFDVIVRSQSLA